MAKRSIPPSTENPEEEIMKERLADHVPECDLVVMRKIVINYENPRITRGRFLLDKKKEDCSYILPDKDIYPNVKITFENGEEIELLDKDQRIRELILELEKMRTIKKSSKEAQNESK